MDTSVWILLIVLTLIIFIIKGLMIKTDIDMQITKLHNCNMPVYATILDVKYEKG